MYILCLRTKQEHHADEKSASLKMPLSELGLSLML
jgi:hypothetical protein